MRSWCPTIAAPWIPELEDKLAATGTEPRTSTPEAFAAYLKSEIAKWGEVIRKAGVRAD